MKSLLLTPAAIRDVENIHDYIAADKPQAAIRFIRTLEEKCELLAESPGLGKRRDELARGLRSHAVGNYVIFYRPSKSGIEVIRILHGGRDIPSIFEREESTHPEETK
ncbi:MAG: type II toxin-antitoxin system RelE/ParE family toxin [Candidatus Sumerlaeota bacterium]|nr:type II toxin-antitoxin system RelE/ParE family toxin [Candidatus Sumerlaeota bacterium]